MRRGYKIQDFGMTKIGPPLPFSKKMKMVLFKPFNFLVSFDNFTRVVLHTPLTRVTKFEHPPWNFHLHIHYCWTLSKHRGKKQDVSSKRILSSAFLKRLGTYSFANIVIKLSLYWL